MECCKEAWRTSECFGFWDCCQASVAHSRQSVLPVPVGLSSNAFWPCKQSGCVLSLISIKEELAAA